jgi:hypothetical protein
LIKVNAYRCSHAVHHENLEADDGPLDPVAAERGKTSREDVGKHRTHGASLVVERLSPATSLKVKRRSVGNPRRHVGDANHPLNRTVVAASIGENVVHVLAALGVNVEDAVPRNVLSERGF